MKRIKKHIIVFLLFVIFMIGILLFFMNKYDKDHLLNHARSLLSYLYNINEGSYVYNNGIIYTQNGSIVSGKFFFDGNGKIEIDKYGNVKFLIKSNNKCINKTSLGNILISNDSCDEFSKINVNIIRNNSKISFSSNKNNLEYKLSTNDDFKGEWIYEEYNGNILLKSFKEGKNYIWFKDGEGNISDVIDFEVSCLSTNGVNYDKNNFYCSGSTIIIDDIEWVVLEDSNNSIKLMKYMPLDIKLSHCLNEKSNYCYYSELSKMEYKWSNSYINYYLNNIYINELSSDIKNNIVINYICDEYDNYTCGNEICGGYTKEEIINHDWNCTNYSPSKIKIISYDEYNYLYSKLLKKKVISGNYWAINSYISGKGSSVQKNYEFYIMEDYTNTLDVKPVITINK